MTESGVDREVRGKGEETCGHQVAMNRNGIAMGVDPYRLYKVFGAAVDASDDPMALGLKHAAIDAVENGVEGSFTDPYDALAPALTASNPTMELVGKLPVPSWLSARPGRADRGLITKERMEAFVTHGGLRTLSSQLKLFVEEKVLPAVPVMLGVDHSATGGVVSALSEVLGPENLSILVIDQHFDCLPVSLRLGVGSMAGLSPSSGKGEYCCGDFWKYLIDDHVVLPENLTFVGVADYPGKEVAAGWETYRDNYLDFERRGCSFFPAAEFEGQYAEKLQRFIGEKLTAPHVYVSLDLDVGSYRCVHAARYMDTEGIDRRALTAIARIVGDSARSERFQLAGVDIMEFNVHFLNLEMPGSVKDDTLGVARDFLVELLAGRDS